MGSFSYTRIDNLDLWLSKYQIDEDALSIFHERDRRVTPDPHESAGDYDDDADPCMWHKYEYAVPAKAMKERLEALGFTANRAQQDYDRGNREECEVQQEWADDGRMSVTQEDVDRLKNTSFQDWKTAFAKGVGRRLQLWQTEEWMKHPEGAILGANEELGVGRLFSDQRLFMRAALEALGTATEVVLDITDLIHGGEYDPEDPVCERARVAWSETHPVYGRIVVLTEGRSDSRILTAGFEKLAPHLADLFGFLDFDGLRIEGSTSALARTIRAFVGAGLSSRVIAVFDNDTAGAEAIDSLRNVRLPANFRVMSLPKSDVAASYPTTGPQGITNMDVNGLAASIELYLSEDALTAGRDALQPVRWTGWHEKLQRYQGAVERKAEIQGRFMQILQSAADPVDARRKFPDLAKVIDQIAFAFA